MHAYVKRIGWRAPEQDYQRRYSPMDLETVMQRLVAPAGGVDRIHTVEEYVQLVERTLSNATGYNQEGSEIHTAAVRCR